MDRLAKTAREDDATIFYKRRYDLKIAKAEMTTKRISVLRFRYDLLSHRKHIGGLIASSPTSFAKLFWLMLSGGRNEIAQVVDDTVNSHEDSYPPPMTPQT